MTLTTEQILSGLRQVQETLKGISNEGYYGHGNSSKDLVMILDEHKEAADKVTDQLPAIIAAVETAGRPVDEAELFSEVFWPILAALEQQASGGVVDAGVIAGKVVAKLIPFLRTPAQQGKPVDVTRLVNRLKQARIIPDLRLDLVYQDGTHDSLEVLIDDIIAALAQQEPPHREVTEEDAEAALSEHIKGGWESTGSHFADMKQGFFGGYEAGLKAAGIVHASGKEGI